MAVGRAKINFLCGNCGADTILFMSTKGTNNDNVVETNYCNVTCTQCTRVYAVKVVVEDRGYNR